MYLHRVPMQRKPMSPGEGQAEASSRGLAMWHLVAESALGSMEHVVPKCHVVMPSKQTRQDSVQVPKAALVMKSVCTLSVEHSA